MDEYLSDDRRPEIQILCNIFSLTVETEKNTLS